MLKEKEVMSEISATIVAIIIFAAIVFSVSKDISAQSECDKKVCPTATKRVLYNNYCLCTLEAK